MTWHPISLTDLQSRLAPDHAECSAEQREFFRRTSIVPAKWRLTPWGDAGGGFWALAVHVDRVLWYNDIENGINVSRFDVPGQIPRDEYWCDQDSLGMALSRLQGEPGTRAGSPEPIADG